MKTIILMLALSLPVLAEKEPKYITQDDYKKMLIENIEIPRSMDRDYHKKLKERKELVKTIESGKMDTRIALATAQHNQALAAKSGDEEKAKLFAVEIESIAQVIEAKAAKDAATWQMLRKPVPMMDIDGPGGIK